jgi:hypothetical protein
VFPLSLGIFPSRLKYSVVTLLYKKGVKNSLAKYRPILLLTSFSKVFEMVLYERIMTHIHNKNILLNEQFGLVPRSLMKFYNPLIIQEELEVYYLTWKRFLIV